MASILLKNVLTNKIPIGNFIKWLGNEELGEAQILDIESHGCGRGEFVIYFINHLRDETSSILNSSQTVVNPMPVKTPRRNSVTKATRRRSTHSDIDVQAAALVSRQKTTSSQPTTPIIRKVAKPEKSVPTEKTISCKESSELSACNLDNQITPVRTKRNSTRSLTKSGSNIVNLENVSDNLYSSCFSDSASIYNSTPLKDISASQEWLVSPRYKSNVSNNQSVHSSLNNSRHKNNLTKSADKRTSLGSTAPEKSPINPWRKSPSAIVDQNLSNISENVSTSTDLRLSSKVSSRNSEHSYNNSFCLGDFIVVDKKTPKVRKYKANSDLKNDTTQLDQHVKNNAQFTPDSKATRRIKPTCLVTNSSHTSTQKNDSAIFSPNIRDIEPNPVFKILSVKEDVHVTGNRDLLRAECLKIQKEQKCEVPPVATFAMTPKKNSINTEACDLIVPNIKSVTHQIILDVYIELYCTFLNKNLILNIMNEIYFIVSLLQATQMRPETYDSNFPIYKSKANSSKGCGKRLIFDIAKPNVMVSPEEESDNTAHSINTKLCSKSDTVLSSKSLFNSGNSNNPVESQTLDNGFLIPRSSESLTENSLKNDTYFHTIHNCIYFAVHVLMKQLQVLTIFDKVTLKLLRENIRVQQFSQDAYKDFQALCESKINSDSNVLNLDIIAMKDANTNVSYISDTDNRSNFPSNVAFHSFRKQRDLFYDILRHWEGEHLNPNWNFVTNVGSKIKSLLNQNSEPLNCMHLARLFKSQLLRTCGFTHNHVEDDNTISSSLKNVSAAKLSLLQLRLTSHQAGRNNSFQDFPGHQEFYRDFIFQVEKPQFLRHLKDSFISELHELHADGFSIRDLNINDDIDEETKFRYSVAVFSMKLIAKFLAVVECLPYLSAVPIPVHDGLLSMQVDVRSKIINEFDSLFFLHDAIRNRTLILTIPWICDYLGALDYVTIRLPYFSNILHTLFRIYNHCNWHETVQSHPHRKSISTSDLEYENESFRSDILNNLNLYGFIENMPAESLFLIRLCLGWLFERMHFPEELYFNWLTNSNTIKNNMPYNSSLATSSTVSNLSSQCEYKRIDSLQIVDYRIIRKLCPHMDGLKQLLMSNNSNIVRNRNLTSRHITPVTTIAGSSSIGHRQLQLQLEETFFNSHAASMRKTVVFVAERVASAGVKHICSKQVPYIKQEALSEVRNIMANFSDSNNIENSKMEKKRLSQVLAEKCLAQVNEHMCPRFVCEERCEISLRALLSPDLPDPVISACVSYAVRQAKDKVRQWIQSRVSLDTFQKDIEIEFSKYIPTAVEKNGTISSGCSKNADSFESTKSAVSILCTLRNIQLNILEQNNVTFTIGDLHLVLEQVINSMTTRNEYFSTVHRQIMAISLDLAVILVSYTPSWFLTEYIMAEFIKIWSMPVDQTIKIPITCAPYVESLDNTFNGKPAAKVDPSLNITVVQSSSENRFLRIACSRNLAILERSPDPVASWKCFGHFLVELLKAQIIDTKMIDEQCTAFFRLELSTVILQHLSICLNVIREEYRSWQKGEDEFTFILECLTELCVKMNEF